MNCKPGDLARTIDAGASEGVGLWVIVIDDYGIPSKALRYVGQTLWVCESASGGKLPDSHGRQHDRLLIPDGALRPIRDPGDDAQDETLQWLPVPSQHKEVV
jgi:hypothetical protein